MVQIQKSEKKAVYRYLLQEGVICLHKDFSNEPHKGTNVINIHLRKIMRSLKDRGLVEVVFSWQHFYYFLTNDGKKWISESLNLTEEVVPLTWKYPPLHSGKTRSASTSTSSTTTGAKLEGKESPELPELSAGAAGVLPAVRGASARRRERPSSPKPPQPDVRYLFDGQLAI